MSGAQLYVIRNLSCAAEVTPAAIEQIRADVESAHNTVFAPVWGVLAIAMQVAAANPGADVSCRRIELVDALDHPDMLAYHSVDVHGRPLLRVGMSVLRETLAAGETLLDALSKALSHEVFEASRNPFVAFFCFVPGHAAMQAAEVCDPVQGMSFRHGQSAISNFVLPSYWDIFDLDGPYDHLGELVAPLSCAANGYVPWSDGTQTFGEEVPEHVRGHVAKYGRVAHARREAGRLPR